MELKTLPFQVSQEIVDLALADSALHKRHQAEKRAAHDKLWGAVHEAYPELEEDANYSLNCSFAEQGIVMLELADNKQQLGQMLSRVLKDMN